MIDLINKDGYIFDLEYRVVDMLTEYQKTGSIVLTTNNEGISLDSIDFYKLLDYITDKFSIDKNKITIYTGNKLEQHTKYNVICRPNHWFRISNDSIPIDFSSLKKQELKTLGCFVGKITWHRLILLSWLYNNHRDNCLLTCHYRNEVIQQLSSELTELNFHSSSSLVEASEFLINKTPLVLGESFNEFTIGPPEHLTILSEYQNIFTDLVIETYVMGDTFFPTEKTMRPLIAKTPFIVMGPKNYLSNLKKIGFRTFNQWWNEDYDQYEGAPRIEEIKKIVTNIMLWTPTQMQTALNEMQEILEHNFMIYKQQAELIYDDEK